MQYKILEQNGIDNENVDGAAFNNFCAGGRDGIFKGVLDECSVIKISDNTVNVSKGEMLIHGVRVKIVDYAPFTISSTPVSPTRYQLIADLTLTAERHIDFDIICRVVQPELIQEDLYRTESGHYQVEIARFTHSPDNGIEDIVRILDIITGGTSGGAGSVINIGNVTTTTLAPGTEAEVDVEPRYDEQKQQWVIDYQFAIPEGKTGPQGQTGPVGATGATGATGADGISPTIEIGEVTTLPAGEDATVTNSGTAENVILDFAIPQGKLGLPGILYGVCNTAANVQEKAIELSDFALVVGAKIAVKFTGSNTVSSPTLNVNETGAIPVKCYTRTTDLVWIAEIIEFIYDGEYWCIVGGYSLADKPVGYYYHAAVSTNPAVLFGGSWTAIDAGYYLKSITSGTPSYESAGLPNIVGTLNKVVSANTVNGTGALSYETKENNEITARTTENYYPYWKVSFNANRYNPIYGNSTTVTPLNYGSYIWRRIL